MQETGSTNPILLLWNDGTSKLMQSYHKGKKHFMSSGHNTGKKIKTLNTVKMLWSKQKQNLNRILLLFLYALLKMQPPEKKSSLSNTVEQGILKQWTLLRSEE